jgi:MATE family multidrug resistance protein
VILAYTLQNSLQTISVLIVGRLGPEALAVSAFCYSEYSRLRVP